MKNKIVFFITSLLITANLHASNISFSGDVSGEWNADTVFVTGNITVPYTKTLIINAGCCVLFQGFYSLTTVGEVIALGTALNKIRFESSDTTGFSQASTAGGWVGIIIQNGLSNPSRFEYCSFRFIKYGSNTGSCIYLQYGYSAFKFCNFYDNRAPYIMQKNIGKHIVQNCVFTNNESVYAIARFPAGLYDTVYFENNTIVNNKGPAFYYDGYVQSVCILTNNIFWNNQSNFGKEIVYNSYNSNGFDTSTMILRNCIVQNGAQFSFFNNTCFEKYPKFTDTVNRDFSPRWDNYPTNDSTRSIAIDNGYYLSSPDPDSSRSDIGAISYNKVNGPLHTWARFSIDTALGYRNNHRVQFTNLSNDAGVATNWLWEFGDGNTSLEKNPIHTYTKSGKFTVKLLAIDPDGHKDSLVTPDAITVFSGTRVNSGIVNSIWEKKYSPYYIYGDIRITDSNRLSINPGVEVLFMGPYTFDIYGSLLANGNVADSITFKAYDTTGMQLIPGMNIDYPFADFQNHRGWGGIHFLGNKSDMDSCVLQYCNLSDVRFGRSGGSYRSKGALKIHKLNTVIITNSSFKNNFTPPMNYITQDDTANVAYYTSGISIVDVENQIIAKNRFENLYQGGPAAIFVGFSDKVEISQNEFYNINGNAIGLYGNISYNISENYFEGGRSNCLSISDKDTGASRTKLNTVLNNTFTSSGRGIIGDVYKARFSGNVFRNNASAIDVCMLLSGDHIYISNNLFHDNRIILTYSNIGATCIHLTLINSKKAVITNNTFVDNWGSPYQSIIYGDEATSLYNNILRNKSGAELWAFKFTTSYFFSNFSKAHNNNVNGGYSYGTGNYDELPDFVEPLIYNFRLKKKSTSINRGFPDTTNLFLPTIDFFGNQRVDPYSNKIDVGFFEYNSQMPTQLILSNDTIMENMPPMTFIGKLRTIDPDPSDIFTYSLVNISGVSNNNIDFVIKGDSIFSGSIFSFSQSARTVSIRTKDDMGAYLDSSFSIVIKANSVTGLSDPLIVKQIISVYPNPFSTQLILEPKILTKIVWSIHEPNGAVLKKGIVQNKTLINLGFLSPGVYILRLIDKGQHYSIKILKQ